MQQYGVSCDTRIVTELGQNVERVVWRRRCTAQLLIVNTDCPTPGLVSCLSVRPSVTLVDCNHTRWNSTKIISRLISLGTWLLADTNITDLIQREHP